MGRPKKTGHKSHDKVIEQDWKAKEGHNSGAVNPEVQSLFAEHEAIHANIKILQKDQKALRVKAKDEFGIPTRVFTIIMGMRKLDPNVRAELESSILDTNAMLGYQMSLNLLPPATEEEGKDPLEAASKKVTSFKKKESRFLDHKFLAPQQPDPDVIEDTDDGEAA